MTPPQPATIGLPRPVASHPFRSYKKAAMAAPYSTASFSLLRFLPLPSEHPLIELLPMPPPFIAASQNPSLYYPTSHVVRTPVSPSYSPFRRSELPCPGAVASPSSDEPCHPDAVRSTVDHLRSWSTATVDVVHGFSKRKTIHIIPLKSKNFTISPSVSCKLYSSPQF
jgi:hypothetical protein